MPEPCLSQPEQKRRGSSEPGWCRDSGVGTSYRFISKRVENVEQGNFVSAETAELGRKAKCFVH